MELKFVKNQTETSAEMLIYNNIGDDGTNGQRFADELNYLSSFNLDEIKIRINSAGGSVLDGFAIFSAIANSNANVNTYIDGVAASMAGVIAMAGKKRYMVDFGKIMIHDPHMGRKPANDKEIEILNTLKQSLVSIFENNTNLSKESIDEMMANETWLNVDQAIEMGFVDGSYTTKRKASKKKIAMATTEQLIEMACALHDINTKNENKMELLKNHFGLAVESTENDVMDKISEVENKISELNIANNELNETINSLEETKSELLNQIEVAANTIKDLENTIAENKVDQAIASGKLDPAKRDELVEIAQNNGELFETMIGAFKKPVVKISNMIGTVENGREKWNIRDWEKNDSTGLRKMKNENVEQYNKLFNDYYKK